MCEYCGCDQIEAIAELTAEHDRLRELGRLLAAAAHADDVAGARAAAGQMRAVLRPHTEVEEVALFPAMAVEYPDQIAALTGEHRELERVLAALAGDPLPADWAVQANAAVEDLFEHILKEQDGVFPASVTTLGAHDWDAVDDVRRRVGSALAAAPA